MMMKTLRVAAALLWLASPAMAQGVGQLGSGLVWGNSTGARAPAAPSTITAMLDRAISSTQGAVLTRQASAWVGLAPGTAGLALVSGGAAANVGYAILGLSGGGLNAALTASNGGIFYSTATAGAVLAGTATAGQIVRSGATAAPSWSTATYPATAGTAANVLRSDGTNFLSASLAIADLASGGKVSSPTAGIGYVTGAGGTVTQATSKSTTVVLNTSTGAITMNNAALAAATIVSFTLTNSAIAATDVLVLNHISGGTPGSYTLAPQAGAGSATINVRNNTAGSLSEAIVIQFAVIKGVNS